MAYEMRFVPIPAWASPEAGIISYLPRNTVNRMVVLGHQMERGAINTSKFTDPDRPSCDPD
ncbi:aldehyde dehydrogenase [Anopheles sinensis]|uniref:Aldehyde dehydrogenase n=1 Tax=Anopheles sinensis TaxID=74873 RepID=A0A084VDS9_ANOSI|nr:aldehyde dehydrogenase [Anopheles sinensis]